MKVKRANVNSAMRKKTDEKDTVTCMPSTALSTKARVPGSLKPFVTLLP